MGWAAYEKLARKLNPGNAAAWIAAARYWHLR
jgi:hypothetical protein